LRSLASLHAALTRNLWVLAAEIAVVILVWEAFGPTPLLVVALLAIMGYFFWQVGRLLFRIWKGWRGDP
jgi:hypothetical protein